MTIAELLARSPLEPLDGPDGVAEQLVALAHSCIDWDIWGGPKAIRYWDALSDRVRAACYAGPTLADWWARLTTQMHLSAPHSAADRKLLTLLLACGDDRRVLDVLRARTETIVLRVRVAVEQRKQDREAERQRNQQQQEQEQEQELVPFPEEKDNA